MYKSARNCIFGHLLLFQKLSILFFQSNRIFHLSIVGTRQATIYNNMTEKATSRNDEVISRRISAHGYNVMNSMPKANRKFPSENRGFQAFFTSVLLDPKVQFYHSCFAGSYNKNHDKWSDE